MKLIKYFSVVIIVFALYSSIVYAQNDDKDGNQQNAHQEKNDKAKGDAKNELTKKKNERVRTHNIAKKDFSKVTLINNEESEEIKPISSYADYDFIPGEQTIFYDDFSEENIGELPSNWTTNSVGYAVPFSNRPGNCMFMKNGGAYFPEIELLKKLPENFALELEVVAVYKKETGCVELDLFSSLSDERLDNLYPGRGGCAIQINSDNIYIYNWSSGRQGNISQRKGLSLFNIQNGKPLRISVSVQKQRLSLYYEGIKVYDVPHCIPSGIALDRIRFLLSGCEASGSSIYITKLRIALLPNDFQGKFINEGIITTRNILFYSGKENIKPESYSILKEIANVLKQDTVKVNILVHTDSDGGEEFNLELSQKRADAVKNALITEFSIDANRMISEGKGMSLPVSPNNTSEGRFKNRRVEFVKLEK